MSMTLLLSSAALTETLPPGVLKKPTPNLQRPAVTKQPPVPKSAAPPARPPISIPHTTNTRALEMIGNPRLPVPPEAFKSIILTTAGLEMLGSPNPAPAVSDTFKPKTLETDPLEMIGQPAR